MAIKKFAALTVISILASGCAQIDRGTSHICNIEGADYQYCHYIANRKDSGEASSEAFDKMPMIEGESNLATWESSQSGAHFKRVNEYAEQLSMDLMDNMHGRYLAGTVAITSFVNFDHTLNKTDPLGNQLAESLIHELKQYGVATVDFKNTDYIKITDSGDFAFSRKAEEIARKQQIDYVLSGTMIRNPRGVVVQARIVNLGTNQVKTSAKSFIPNILFM